MVGSYLSGALKDDWALFVGGNACQWYFSLWDDIWKISDLSMLCSLESRFPEKMLLASCIEGTGLAAKILEPCEGTRLEISSPYIRFILIPMLSTWSLCFSCAWYCLVQRSSAYPLYRINLNSPARKGEGCLLSCLNLERRNEGLNS